MTSFTLIPTTGGDYDALSIPAGRSCGRGEDCSVNATLIEPHKNQGYFLPLLAMFL
jgi:hypothetical protein